ncbi:conserved uncharacterised protein [Klebsiella phage 05F01]|nr:conserved uncharacterised protein [Klebsiella phage 05F01]
MKVIVKEYIVKPGDTLSGIAKELYGDSSTYLDIAEVNKIENTNLIFPGQVLKLPYPATDKNFTLVTIKPTREALDRISSLFSPGFCDGRMEYAIYAAALGVEEQSYNT